VALGQVFSEYFCFPCQPSFHQKFSNITITRGRYNRPFSGRRAEWTQYGLHPPLCEFKKKNLQGRFVTCPSVLKAVGIRFPVRNIRDFNLNLASFSRNKCRSLPCASAANEICTILNKSDNNFFSIYLLVNLANRLLRHRVTFSVVMNFCLPSVYYAAVYVTCMYLSCILFVFIP
jgi:hypothetical protein